MWCNTVPDPDGELGDAVTLARDHRWGPKCPRVDEGKAYLETRPVGNARFMLPPARDGGKKREVTRSFFKNLFILSEDKITSLHRQRKKADPVTKPATGAGAGSGKHGNRRTLSEEDKTRLDKVIMKFVSDAQDHYARQESLGDTVVLEQGVTRREIWWDFCGLFDKPFWEQCTRMKHRWGFDQHPPKLEEYAKDSAEKLIKPRVPYHRATEHINQYKLRFGHLRVDVCRKCENLRFRIACASETERKDLEEELRVHQEQSHTCYDFMKQDNYVRTYQVHFCVP